MELDFSLFKEATREHYDLLLDADPSKEAVSKYLQRSFCFEARRNIDLVGVLILLPTRPETVEIVNIAVSEAFQQQGIGTQLLEFALKWASENNYRIVEIGTGSTSFGQLYLYQKCGFRIVGVDSDFFIRNYKEPIFENKLRLLDMVRLHKYI
ncbi:hypothetical protein HG537_0G04960 [Torulaspora globosa]|uniref:N-acetyltransferase domain-containing protein n=1 Tax=Torulaspora globosa TaxID=48254 RepID=A0A7H9HXW9_9SACH|nr:hypothetical protein HG537_0G04960 [Torulaspora sp. CBS 2947]